MAAEWSKLTPPGPKGVEQARAHARDLRERLVARREALEQARADLVRAEQADRQAVARAVSEGREPASDVKTVERARSLVAARERELQGHELAIADAEAAMHEAVLAARREWSRSVEATIPKARERGRRLVEQFERVLGELREAHSVARWLGERGGFEQEQPTHSGGLPVARSTVRWSANSEPVATRQLLDAIAELVAEPEPPKPPLEPQPLKPIGAVFAGER
jgi:hypothetical protein